ncbi:site-specific integrase [Bacillus sp. 2205SS5-2]|uniref:site-specific integrase n=1 Tax=Bacillus sp. 2205SS5-2 TaxID=3109031 RepID=UPI003006A532
MLITSNKYKYIVKEIRVRDYERGQIRTKKVICIGLIDKESGLYFPHPLTDFIRIKYELVGRSLNSQTLPAYVVCRFLNFVNSQIHQEDMHFSPLIESGIYGLNLKHGSMFISHLTSKGLSYSTVTQYERILTTFYYYLKEVSFLHIDLPEKPGTHSEINKTNIFRGAQLQTKVPSKRVRPDKRSKLKDFGENRYELTYQFINIAREITPDIAFGICLQFFGGLRRGEIVNLTRGDILVNYRNSINVEIRDNREKLFKHLKDTKSEYPKRLNYLQSNLCVQTIIDTDLVWETYDEHIKALEYKSEQKMIKNPFSFFVDTDGKPMSGKVYERRFKKVKKYFLASLLEANRFSEYKVFTEAYWGTHIGRGIFTNFLLDMGLTVTQIAIARGDRNINSSMAYVDQKLSTELINKAINDMKNASYNQNTLFKTNPKDGKEKRETRFSYY